MTKKRILALLLAALLAFTLMCAVTAAFDSNDYDYSDSSSDSDGDGVFWILYTVFRVLADVIGIPGALIIVAILGVIIFYARHKLKKLGKDAPQTRNAGGTQGANVYLQNRTEQIEALIQKQDKEFNAAEFIMFSNKVFKEIEAAWCAKNLETVREYMHTNLYNATNRQLEQIVQRGITYHYENITLDSAYLNSYVRDGQFEYLTVYLAASMVDYQTEDATGSIVKGDKSTIWKQRYTMKYMRTVGVTTSGAGQTTTGQCPNCGAPLELSASGECKYCGSVITTGVHTWVLSDFGTVRNDTVDGGVKISDESNPQ